MERKMSYVHPGETLKMELVEGRKLSLENIAELLDTPILDISNILNGEASITPAIALKLANVFGGSVDFYLRLQNNYDYRNNKKIKLDTILSFNNPVQSFTLQKDLLKIVLFEKMR